MKKFALKGNGNLKINYAVMLIYDFFLDLFAKHLKANNKYPAVLKADNL